jgi:nucleoside-diphosphate-sugar epimerase
MTKIMLTGASGFMGSFVVSELLDPDCIIKTNVIRLFDTREYQGPPDPRIEVIKADILDYEKVREACMGVDLVIHAAAIVDWGTKSDEEVLAVNVGGTRNIIEACLANNVKHLVFTSSLDAVFGGKELKNIDEGHPYPEKFPNSYCKSKYEAEMLVKEAVEKSGLNACILRPSDVYGEGDPYHIGSLVDMAKGGFYVQLGNGKSKSQHVYGGNIAWAHILAAHSLLTGNKEINGKAYFITDGPGSNFFTFYTSIVEAAGYKIRPRNFWIPRGIALVLGFLSEGVAFMIRPIKKYQPKMSRFAVIYTCSDFTFTSARANRDFGFKPKYDQQEAFDRTVRYYKRDELKQRTK